MPSIILENVQKSFNSGKQIVHAIRGVSLELEGAKSVALIGPSGSGKSTLLNLIGLLLKADRGTIRINGQEPSMLKDKERCLFRNRTFGYILQDYALINEDTAWRNIGIPLLYNREISHKEKKERIARAAKDLGISHLLRQKAGRLSGGEQQRVAIARALVCDQDIILADEPTGSLDSDNKKIVMDLLLNLCQTHNVLLFIATHDLDMANRCDHILKCIDGRISDT